MPERTGHPQATYALDARCRLIADGGRLILISDQSAAVLRGTATPGLIATGLALLDGRTTQGEIAERLGVPLAQWAQVVDRILAAGLASAGDAATADAPVGAQLLFGAAPDGDTNHDTGAGPAPTSLAAARLHLLGSNGALVDALARSWVASGGLEPTCGTPQQAPPGSLWVHASVDDGEVTRTNAVAIERSQPWLHLPAYDGEVLAVGPLHVPEQTCCSECVRIRRAANAPYPAPQRSARLLASPRLHAAPLVVRLQAELAVLVAGRFALNPSSTVVGTVHALSLADLRSSTHRVLRVPRCPACSPAGDRAIPYPWTRTADVVR